MKLRKLTVNLDQLMQAGQWLQMNDEVPRGIFSITESARSDSRVDFERSN
jgi:hypothetical protein